MSAAPASGAVPTTKIATTDKNADSTKEAKPAAALEEDDEFEDFPVESMFALPRLSSATP
jgi:26 proteasome complex subunit DSS1